MRSAPTCNPAQHAYRGKRGVFGKGILCLCGGRVLDRNVRGRSSWLVATGWRTLLVADADDYEAYYHPNDLPQGASLEPR